MSSLKNSYGINVRFIMLMLAFAGALAFTFTSSASAAVTFVGDGGGSGVQGPGSGGVSGPGSTPKTPPAPKPPTTPDPKPPTTTTPTPTPAPTTSSAGAASTSSSSGGSSASRPARKAPVKKKANFTVQTYVTVNGKKTKTRIGNVAIKIERAGGGSSCSNHDKTTVNTNPLERGKNIKGRLNFLNCEQGKYTITNLGRPGYKVVSPSQKKFNMSNSRTKASMVFYVTKE